MNYFFSEVVNKGFAVFIAGCPGANYHQSLWNVKNSQAVALHSLTCHEAKLEGRARLSPSRGLQFEACAGQLLRSCHENALFSARIHVHVPVHTHTRTRSRTRQRALVASELVGMCSGRHCRAGHAPPVRLRPREAGRVQGRWLLRRISGRERGTILRWKQLLPWRLQPVSRTGPSET